MTTQPALPPVLYEDEHLLALDKPAGLLVCPDRWNKDLANLADLVHDRLSAEYFNAHRLDRQTSGVVLFGKTRPAVQALQAMFETRQVRKTYLALVRPAPADDRGQIEAGIVPHPKRQGRMVIGGPADSRTDYEVLERWRGGLGLVRCFPLTGRTHQIRIHLMHIRSPIIADDLYGDEAPLLLSQIKRGYKHGGGPETPLIGRLALHAESLALDHPITHQPLTIQAPLPRDFEIALKNLRKYGR